MKKRKKNNQLKRDQRLASSIVKDMAILCYTKFSMKGAFAYNTKYKTFDNVYAQTLSQQKTFKMCLFHMPHKWTVTSEFVYIEKNGKHKHQIFDLTPETACNYDQMVDDIVEKTKLIREDIESRGMQFEEYLFYATPKYHDLTNEEMDRLKIDLIKHKIKKEQAS